MMVRKELFMDLENLIAEIRASCFGSDDVVVIQTHISVVFLAGDRAYKLKKPLDLGFLDYSTPQRRREFCEAEVRLNQRLAPGVYLGVRSIVSGGGGLRLSDADDPAGFEWVVEMERLRDEDTFLAHLHAGTVEPAWMEELGRVIAEFHRDCAPGEPGRFGSFETVARNARENFSQSQNQVGLTVSASVIDKARAATDDVLGRLEPVIEARDRAGRTRDTHGDLRLEHVYRVEGKLLIVDCIEFNDAFRFSDPVADIAFLVMDLRIRWGEALASVFTAAYFEAAPGGEDLLDFYVSYRSAVRAKVHGIGASEPEMDAKAHERAMVKSRAHWLFTWATLAPPAQRPAMVLVAGLPGTGKSTLARHLGAEHGFDTIDSDEVRKELAGVPASASMRAEPDTGIYTPEWTQRTYAECLDRAMTAVSEGRRVAVSATFRSAALRSLFLREAHARGVCGIVLECVLEPEEARRRIEARRGDASDADATTYKHIAVTWEAPDEFVAARTVRVSTATRAASEEDAARALREFGLAP